MSAWLQAAVVLFAALTVAVAILVVAITYLPALALGPLAEGGT